MKKLPRVIIANRLNILVKSQFNNQIKNYFYILTNGSFTDLDFLYIYMEKLEVFKCRGEVLTWLRNCYNLFISFKL